MRVILFDIDGTLTATTNADNGCYETAFAQTFGFSLPTTDWHQYRHVTDHGIVQEVMEWSGKPAAPGELLQQFEDAYEQALANAFAQNPTGFSEVPGAKSILEFLRIRDDVRIALATGGMRKTALFKLRQIGVDGAALPGAFSNDAISRADIASTALLRTGVAASDIVYVGDGAWDVATSAELGMRFIGICREYARERLIDAGATVILDNYTSVDCFLDAVEAATVPARRGSY
ncbi:MAG: HAD hydrolase-like protein [Candidatus Hydrogenedentes bacterium]|nr:HAD hydrolase-like protein [Candidatus Hydrogenedentota bacterium]